MTNSEKYKTAKERAEAFNNFCNNNVCQKCFDDSMSHAVPCLLKWLDLEAEEEEKLPCPFCGSTDVVIQDVGGFELACQGCGFHTPSYMDTGKLISEYQRVARAVMATGKKEAKE